MPPNTAPVTPACVVAAADMQQVPLAALVSIMSAEGGRVGQRVSNTNGTHDYGPMQINTIWLPEIRKAGITEDQLLNDGCVNVLIGAWILRRQLRNASTSMWTAIGHYHSHTTHIAERYRKRVLSVMRKLSSIKDVVDHANSR